MPTAWEFKLLGQPILDLGPTHWAGRLEAGSLPFGSIHTGPQRGGERPRRISMDNRDMFLGMCLGLFPSSIEFAANMYSSLVNAFLDISGSNDAIRFEIVQNGKTWTQNIQTLSAEI